MRERGGSVKEQYGNLYQCLTGIVSLYTHPEEVIEQSHLAFAGHGHRQKRQLFFGLGLLVGAGVVALGSYLFSSAGLTALSVSIDKGPSDAAIETLKKMLAAADMQKAKTIIEQLVHKVETLQKEREIADTVSLLEECFHQLSIRYLTMAEGLEEISTLHFSTKLIDPACNSTVKKCPTC